MPNTKVVNLSGGMYRSDSPEQIPEVSWTDLVNMDFADKAVECRDGHTQTSTTPLYPGCLQFGYSASDNPSYLQTKGGSFGPLSPTYSSWACFVYAKEGTGTTTSKRVIFALTDSSNNTLIELGWDASDNLYASSRAVSTTFMRTITYASSRTSTTPLYGVKIEVATTTEYTMKLYDHTGSVASTIIDCGAAFDTMTDIWLGCDKDIANRYYGYIGELIFTKNENISTTDFKNSRALPPGDMVATANRIAYYPLQKDLKDKWSLQSAFRDPPLYKTGAGLHIYDIEDALLTSPQAKNELPCTKSWHIDTVDKDKYLYHQSDTVSTTYQGYLNSNGAEYTLTCDIIPSYMGTTSTSYTFFSCKSGRGPKIAVKYANTKEVRIEYTHTYDAAGTATSTIFANIPLGEKSTLMFDFQHNSDTTAGSAEMKIYRKWGEVASGTLTSGATTPGDCTVVYFGRDGATTHDTTNVSLEAYFGCFLGHHVSVATTWSKKPDSDIGTITEWGLETIRISGGINLRGGDAPTVTPTGEPYPGSVPTTPQLKTFITRTTRISEGEQQDIYDRNILPNFSDIFLAHFFNEVSGYDYASTTTDQGRLINAVDKSNENASWLNSVYASAPIWIEDRNSVGLVQTDYLATEYLDEFDNAFSFLPTKDNIGDKLLLANNMYLMDNERNTYKFDSTWEYGRKRTARTRGLMYGNNLYFFNKHKMFRYDGREVFPVEQITPTMPLTITATSINSSGLNGAYMYTYTFVGKNGMESRAAIPTSCTVHLGKVSVKLDLDISTASYIHDSVEYVNFYRNKGSVGSSTVMVDNNATYFYHLRQMPLETVKQNAGSILFYDKVADHALGKELTSGYTTPMPPCKYATLYKEFAVFTGDEKAPNHYYSSRAETPEIIDLIGEFRTESGEENTGIAQIGSGFIVFKNSSRKYVPYGDETKASEWHDGGCVAHDSLVSFGDEVIGLGHAGFFKTNGHRYINLNETYAEGRPVSSIEKDVDDWSLATKQAARAVFHEATNRYICYVDSKYYVYDIFRNSWRKYEDFIGQPVIYKGDFYIYKKGWLWDELSSQGYVQDAAHIANISSGGIGTVTAVSTTTLPTTNEYGLPCYIDNEFTWIRKISAVGNTYTVYLADNTDFSSASKLRIGIMECYPQTKYFEERTAQQNKMWKRLLLDHEPISDGTIEIQYVRNSGTTFNDNYYHFKGDTTKGQIKTWVQARSRNISFKYRIRDGNKHKLKSYTIEYEQQGYGL